MMGGNKLEAFLFFDYWVDLTLSKGSDLAFP